MKDAGWLAQERARNEHNIEVFVYKLRVDKIEWHIGNKETVIPDKIRRRYYTEVKNTPVNKYFQQFYLSDLNQLKHISGKEHTGQINSDARREREILFKKGALSALYCSPTMELTFL